MEHLGTAGAGGQKRTELPRVPVHGAAAGMEREASAQHGVAAETSPLPVGQNAGAVRLQLPAWYRS